MRASKVVSTTHARAFRSGTEIVTGRLTLRRHGLMDRRSGAAGWSYLHDMAQDDVLYYLGTCVGLALPVCVLWAFDVFATGGEHRDVSLGSDF